MTDQTFKGDVSGQVAGRDIINTNKSKISIKEPKNVIHVNFSPNNDGQLFIANEPIHIHNHHPAPVKVKVVVQPGDGCIDEPQKAQLKMLVTEVVRLEGLLKRTPKTFASVWVAVNAKCKASSYHLITQENYPRAEKFLREWIGRLSSTKSAPAKDGNWRNRKYSYIFTNIRKLDADVALRQHLQTRFGNDSLKGLSDDDLMSIYSLVAGWKKAGHAPGQANA